MHLLVLLRDLHQMPDGFCFLDMSRANRVRRSRTLARTVPGRSLRHPRSSMQSRPMHSINSLSQFWVYVERAGLGPAVGLGHSRLAYRRPRLRTVEW